MHFFLTHASKTPRAKGDFLSPASFRYVPVREQMKASGVHGRPKDSASIFHTSLGCTVPVLLRMRENVRYALSPSIRTFIGSMIIGFTSISRTFFGVTRW